MKEELVVGVDLGTTKAKTGLFDTRGSMVRFMAAEYPVDTDGGADWAEQDAEAWWEALCEMLPRLIEGVSPERIKSICVGGQGPTLVMVDDAARPLAPAILWMDNRSSLEQAELAEHLGEEVSPYSYIPKAMWLAKNRPNQYGRARWFLSAWDFIGMRLTGRAIASYYGPHFPFPRPHLEAGGLEPWMAPPEVEVGEVLGEVTAHASQETGLPSGLPVVAGVNDGMETFIGAGIVQVGRAVDTGGTSGGFALCWDEPLDAQGAHAGPGILPDQFIVGGSMSSQGKSLDWWREVLDTGSDYEAIFGPAFRVSPGAGGLLFLPYLAGARSPAWDPRARGAFVGLTLRHHAAEMSRAVIESAALSLRHVAEPILESGGEVSELRLCGGQAQSESWNQIKADVTGFPVAVPKVSEAALLGAAVLAGYGVGLFPDLVSCSDTMVQIGTRLEPDSKRHATYSDLYLIYRELYAALRESFHALHNWQLEQEVSST